jgi:DNA polymerase-3 subunit gamma/tau
MLGLADRGKLISLFKEILEGSEKKAIQILKDLIDCGLDSKNFLNDFLEILYLFSRRINLGPIEKDTLISESEIQMIDQYSKDLDMQDIGIFWQLTIKTIEDLKIVSNENLSLEMYVMQLIHLKDINQKNNFNESERLENNISTETKTENEIKKKDIINDNISTKITNQLKNTEQLKTNVLKERSAVVEKSKDEIRNFTDLINLAEKENEVELKYDLERNVNLVSFSKGKIDISFNENLNKNFIKVLTEKLLSWTKERWIISLSKKSGEKTEYEKKKEAKLLEIIEISDSKKVKEILSNFPDAKLVEVKKND